MDFLAVATQLEPISTTEESFEHGSALDDLSICVRSPAFSGGKLTAVMSDVTIDLREATLSPEGATLSLQTALSGIDLLVPRDWDVVYELKTVFGGTFDERFPGPASEQRPRLRVTGMVVAGGVCVR